MYLEDAMHAAYAQHFALSHAFRSWRCMYVAQMHGEVRLHWLHGPTLDVGICASDLSRQLLTYAHMLLYLLLKTECNTHTAARP